MPIYQLNESIIFPPVHHAENGILAVGGDLSPDRLIEAYSTGIFPWFSENEPIIWWAPDPRCVLYPQNIKVSKSMKQILRKDIFTISFDTDFNTVIKECAIQNRPGQDGTWITDEMLAAYIKLHEMGLAHSVEVKKEGQLVGGLYGVSIGKAFFGESMFFKESNASKVAFIHLVNFLQQNNFKLIDCQVETSHLISLGAELIPRELFMQQLDEALKQPSKVGKWSTD